MNSDIPDPMDSMDASLLQLERELQSLTPVAPGREFLRSLQARMEPVPQVNRLHHFPWRRMVAPAAAAAAAVAVMSFNSNRRAGIAPGSKAVVDGHDDAGVPAIKWSPMPMRPEYRALVDAGYFNPKGNMQQRSQYGSTYDQHEWSDPESNASIRLTIPHGPDLLPAGVEFH